MARGTEFTVKTTGFKEAAKQLRRLSDTTRGEVLRGAMEAAAEPIIRSAQGRAPSAIIAEGIRVVNIESDGGQVTAEVGLPGGRKPWFYGLFVELGTGPRFTKAGAARGSMPARPFLRPAFDAEKGATIGIFRRELKQRLKAVALRG